jgi:hypothetical protein
MIASIAVTVATIMIGVMMMGVTVMVAPVMVVMVVPGVSSTPVAVSVSVTIAIPGGIPACPAVTVPPGRNNDAYRETPVET